MHCPKCSYQRTLVIDTYATEEGVNRKRKCPRCHETFWTKERALKKELPSRRIYQTKVIKERNKNGPSKSN